MNTKMNIVWLILLLCSIIYTVVDISGGVGFIVMTVLLSATLVAAFIISIVVDATISKTSECECEIRKLKDELAELKDSQKNDINNI
ncbi:hypothetical protein AI2935V1_5247 (plasmid) [Citrobacter freundii]|uniref:Uncharacterized protein n=2 Tax=Citrobacter freundii complex TaxID=1344959 RepID=A0AAD1TYN4_CITFR|nr:hypothetical protein AI2935V1_5247 [Citrobacter freundii]CAH6622517.1 hypothetical protein AI2935V1_5247 [Citrobacter freundii]